MDKNSILIALSESEVVDFGKVDFALQSPPQKVFSCIWALESEVNNGGFLQYFQNGSCETAGIVCEALRLIGAERMAALSAKAIDTAFPAGLPDDPEEISSLASSLTEEIRFQLDEIDAEFMRYPDNLTELLFTYVMTHENTFGPVSDLLG